MKKEINYLSFPDHFNRYLFINYNQKINLKSNLSLRFQLTNTKNLGSAIKAIYLLEFFFPRKVLFWKLKIKKKKDFMDTKKITKSKIIYNFDLKLTGYEFIDMLRFFSYKPLEVFKVKNLEYLPLVNRRLKNFDFFSKLKIIPQNLNQSFNFIKLYHFD